MIIRKYMGLCVAGAAFLIGGMSCSDDLNYKESEPVEDNASAEDDDMVEVTLSMNLSGLSIPGTREGETEEVLFNPKDIDLFIYSVRDEQGNVLKQYGKGVVERLDENEENWFEKGVIDEESGKIGFKSPAALKYYTEEDDNNQTLMKVNWIDNRDGTYKMDQVIRLRVMRNKEYKFSCWAQSTKTKAFDFNDLTNVNIDYACINKEVNGEVNDEGNGEVNDEGNDFDAFHLHNVFCSTSTFSIGQIDSEIDITLTRPCAQINVGIEPTEANRSNSNWNIFTAENTESSITLRGLAHSYNVVENKAFNDNNKDVKFEFSHIPSGYFEINNYNSWTASKPGKKTYKSLLTCYVFVPEATPKLDDDGNYEENDSASATDPTGKYKWVNDEKGNIIKLKKVGDDQWEVEEILVYYKEDGIVRVTFKPDPDTENKLQIVKIIDKDGKVYIELTDTQKENYRYTYKSENLVENDGVFDGEYKWYNDQDDRIIKLKYKNDNEVEEITVYYKKTDGIVKVTFKPGNDNKLQISKFIDKDGKEYTGNQITDAQKTEYTYTYNQDNLKKNGVSDGVYKWYNDTEGNIIKFRNEGDKWEVEEVTVYLDDTEEFRKVIFKPDDDDELQRYMLVNKDGKEYFEITEEQKKKYENTYTYNPGNLVDEGFIAPPTPNNVNINLISFSLKGTIGSEVSEVSYPVDADNPIELEVKKNWRTNILFDNWDWIGSDQQGQPDVNGTKENN